MKRKLFTLWRGPFVLLTRRARAGIQCFVILFGPALQPANYELPTTPVVRGGGPALKINFNLSHLVKFVLSVLMSCVLIS